MRDNMSGLFNRALRAFASFTAGQKVVSLLAVVGLVVGGVVFSQWATKPTYAPLFTNLAPDDASAIVDQLNSNGTPYQLSDGGASILVPQPLVYDTRLAMSGKGLTPSADSTGWGLLDKQGVTASKFQQQVAYRRALEGELNKTIEGIDGVSAAVVHLAIPEKDVFTKETDKPKASVLVDTAPGKQLSPSQVQAIVNLISSSVESMDAADVTVADSSGQVLSASADGSSGGAAADGRSQATHDYEDRVSSSLQDMVDRVVGAGHSEVRLTADLDFDQTKTTTEKYTNVAKTPIAGSSSVEKFTGAGGGAGGVLGGTGVLGPDNIAVPSGTAGGGAGNYSKVTATNNNALDRVVEERQSAPGAVRKLNVAVLLDAKTAGTVNPAQIKALIASAVGLVPTRGDTVVVDRLPFDATAAKQAKSELAIEKKANAAVARTSLFKRGALGLLVLLVLLYAWLAGRKKRKRGSLTPDERIQIEALQRSLDAQPDRLALESGKSALPALVASVPDPRAELAAAARTDIGELVKAQPEEVAQLLRGWLADRRG
jgi:flagellar M-ring protein FliF